MRIEIKELNKQVIVRLLEGLKTIDQSKSLKYGISKALNMLTAKGVDNLRNRYKGNTHTGKLEQSLIVRVMKAKLGGIAGFTNTAHHAHLVDMGTVERQTKGGAKRGVMPANRFWRDAVQSEGDAAVNVLMASIATAIEKIKARAAIG